MKIKFLFLLAVSLSLKTEVIAQQQTVNLSTGADSNGIVETKPTREAGNASDGVAVTNSDLDGAATPARHPLADSGGNIDRSQNSSVVYIQNETINKSASFSGDVIKVGSSVTSTKGKGPVYINGGTISMEGRIISISPETTISNKAKLKLSIKK